MNQKIKQWLTESLNALQAAGAIDSFPDPEVKPAKNPAHGDYTSNIAMIISRAAARPAADLANTIIAAHPLPREIKKAEVAGPGFINFYLQDAVRADVIAAILEQGERYGCRPPGSRGRALVEFVSANPTGPLHIGHGRGAAYGAALVNLLTAAGYDTDSEYYINDKGRQMDILTLSVWLRYLDLCGAETDFPAGCYQGDYVWDIAAKLRNAHGEAFKHTLSDVPPEDTEANLDALIARMKDLLREEYAVVFDLTLKVMLDSIRNDLDRLGVSYSRWFSEREELGEKEIAQAIAALEKNGLIYEKEGARWFKSGALGDAKDRVVARANGQTTYFASDIAYHLHKYRRGYDLLVNVWGADHHGYAARITAAMQAAGFDKNKLRIVLVQFVNLYRKKELVAMSTRSGEFYPLAALRKEVGRDATRLFYLTYKYNQHMDFDMALAASRSADNPVYYIQYAHARVCSVFSRLQEKGLDYAFDARALSRLEEEQESDLLKLMAQYPGALAAAAREMEPHALLNYLRTLAGQFHSYYNSRRLIVDDDALRAARLALTLAIGQIIRSGLEMLGASAPQRMDSNDDS